MSGCRTLKNSDAVLLLILAILIVAVILTTLGITARLLVRPN